MFIVRYMVIKIVMVRVKVMAALNGRISVKVKFRMGARLGSMSKL